MSVFGVILVGMRENTDQNNSEYRHFLRSYASTIQNLFRTDLVSIIFNKYDTKNIGTQRKLHQIITQVLEFVGWV